MKRYMCVAPFIYAGRMLNAGDVFEADPPPQIEAAWLENRTAVAQKEQECPKEQTEEAEALDAAIETEPIAEEKSEKRRTKS